MIRRLWIVGCLSALAWACGGGKGARDAGAGKDAATSDAGDDAAVSGKTLGQVAGRVTDVAGAPLAGVTIELAGKSAQSGDDGTFMLGELAAGLQQKLTAERSGFSTAIVRVDVLATAKQSLSITLQPQESALLGDAAKGGMVETPSGVRIELPAGAFVGKGGKPVSGPVKLDIALINDRDEMAAAPGGMIALAPQGSNGEEAPLESFGMVEVSLTAGGDKVELKPGTEVDLVFPLARNHGFKDGDPIALWSFDETANHWVMLGEGVVEGDDFRAKVNHFSWWNADQVLTRACVRGRVLDASGAPVGGAVLIGEGRSYLGSSQATADMSGHFCMNARVASSLQLSTSFQVAGRTQALAVSVSTPRASGSCDDPSACLDLNDLIAVADMTLCDPAQCPTDGERVPCCRTELGPCDFKVHDDCGGNADGSYDPVPEQPGVTPIPGVPMGMPMSDAGVDSGTNAGAGGASGAHAGSAGSGRPDAGSVEPGPGAGAGAGQAGASGASAGAGGSDIGSVDPGPSAGKGGATSAQAGHGGASGGGGPDVGGGAGKGAQADAGVTPPVDGGPGGPGGPGGSGGQGAGGGGSGAADGGAPQPDIDRCAGAIAAADGVIAVSTDTSELSQDWWESPQCTLYAGGFERTYAIVVPAGETLRARITGDESARVVISTACGMLASSCVSTGLEADWTNDGAAAHTAYVTVDSTVLDARGAYTLRLDTRASPSPVECGDGFMGYGAGCDDGDLEDDDGCDSHCQPEPGWFCAPATGCTQQVCGNGVREDEECDDHNTTAGDGCSPSCALEPGYVCELAGRPCREIVCGDGKLEPFAAPSLGHEPKGGCMPGPWATTKLSEQCDDGDTMTGDGCDDHCQVEKNYVCTGVPSRCGAPRTAGDLCNNALTLSEAGYDFALFDSESLGGLPDAFFRAALPPGSVLSVAGEIGFEAQVTVSEDTQCPEGVDPEYFGRSYPLAPGSFVFGFQRDLDTQAGENENVLIRISARGSTTGMLQFTSVSVGTQRCGDAVLQGQEDCDDGNVTAGDGCSDTCHPEVGYVCQGDEGCHQVRCGDGRADWPLENCDVGSAQDVPADGCSATCQLEPGSLCDYTLQPVTCVTKAVLGDLCTTAESVSRGLHTSSYSLAGFTKDVPDTQPCYASCSPTRWFSITQLPGDVTRVSIANAGFEGSLAMVQDNCPADSFASSAGHPFNDYEGTATLAKNDTDEPRRLYIALSAPAASAKTVDLTFDTLPQGCGDGESTGDEECDDGNTSAGDGCSSTCKVEGSQWQCHADGQLCISSAECGDGVLYNHGGALVSEECDDTNHDDTDGCSASCKIEAGYWCNSQSGPSQCSAAPAGAVCSAPLTLVGGTAQLVSCDGACDDSDVSRGWWATTLQAGEHIQIDASGWSSPGIGTLTLHLVPDDQDCHRLSDPLVAAYVSSDGASPLTYYNSTHAPVQVRLQIEAQEPVVPSFSLSVERDLATQCGDGSLDFQREGCDDGGTDDGDGCSAACLVEPGYACAPGFGCTALLPGNLCSTAGELTQSPTTLSFDGFVDDAEFASALELQHATRWVRVNVPAWNTLQTTVGTSDLASVQVTYDELSAAAGCERSRMLAQDTVDASAPRSWVWVNASPWPAIVALELRDTEAGASSGHVSVSYRVTPVSCGDSYVDHASEYGFRESCDDGNTTDGDGCSADCDIELGYDCDDHAGCHAIACGNALREPGEACDDGDTAPGNGCSPNCHIEVGYVCGGDYGEQSTCELLPDSPAGDVCSNAEPLAGGNIDFSGMHKDYTLSGAAGPDVTRKLQLHPGETLVVRGTAPSYELDVAAYFEADLCAGLDVGRLDSWGPLQPNQPFSLELPYRDVADSGVPVDLVLVFTSSAPSPESALTLDEVSAAIPYCGNGVRTASNFEECDDGNHRAADGCSPLCKVEQGYICPPGAACRPIVCSDGHIDRNADWCLAHETCDDTNADDGDGCSSNCQVEQGYRCTGKPSLCLPALPGEDCVSAQTLASGEYGLTNYLPSETCDDAPCWVDRWLHVQVPAGQVLSVQLTSDSASDNARAVLYEQISGCDQLSKAAAAAVTSGSNARLAYFNGSPQARDFVVALSDTSASSGSNLSFEVGEISLAAPRCGDGSRDDYEGDHEQCDDGDTTTGDGCGADCRVEPGWSCSDGSPSVCQEL